MSGVPLTVPSAAIVIPAAKALIADAETTATPAKTLIFCRTKKFHLKSFFMNLVAFNYL